MPDFDALFEEFLRQWLDEHKGEFTADELEEKVPELYETFVTTPCKEADGLTPEEYYARFTDPEELVNAFIVASEGDGNACSLLLDRIVEVDGCDEYLKKIIEKGAEEKVLIASMNLLDEMGATHPLSVYAKWLSEEKTEEGVVEKAVEILKENAPVVKEEILAFVSSLNPERKLAVAEILAECEHDERIYQLLKELFISGNNVPFCAGLIARYNDARASEFLYPALDKCNYLEFVEIRNAIEQMGGSVDDEYRDFTDDPYYKAIKNLA